MTDMEKTTGNLIQELNRGTQVLAVLLAASSSCYGYSLVQSLKSSGIDIEQNTLYPLLRRLERQGLLESSWDTAESRPRKYYLRTRAGTSVMQRLAGEWKSLNIAIEKMISEEESI